MTHTTLCPDSSSSPVARAGLLGAWCSRCPAAVIFFFVFCRFFAVSRDKSVSGVLARVSASLFFLPERQISGRRHKIFVNEQTTVDNFEKIAPVRGINARPCTPTGTGTAATAALIGTAMAAPPFFVCCALPRAADALAACWLTYC